MPGINTFTFSGKSDAKGRNGYFKLDRAEIWMVSNPAGAAADATPIQIDLYSKRAPAGSCGPARLQLNLADLQILRAALEVAENEYRDALSVERFAEVMRNNPGLQERVEAYVDSLPEPPAAGGK